ncbi:zinc-dependent metalloprotease [Sphingosinicella sp. CPCC 101087]|uniref:zinc-dependent metalloprotease n=1 Tax=Sphingosinicella sp. CPCC 101087 TaxID=2497754 RepID=UPI00101C46A3|nr:zinc-dependent metalloprotease [Sphingosinicella sp. CPCC 101087]
MNPVLIRLLSALLIASSPLPALALATPQEALRGTEVQEGLLPVHVDRDGGRILLSLPAPDADGLAGRFIHVTALETGLGSAALGLDRALSGGSRLLVFRRIGRRIAAEIENPRFRAAGAPAGEQEGVRRAFAYSTVWIGDIAAETADGRLLVDISSFLTRDDMNIAQALREQENGDYRLDSDLSIADTNFVRVFPRNIELQSRLTFVSAKPGPEVGNIVPVRGNASFVVRHSLIALPEPGYQPRRFDPRAGTFGSQVVDFAAPLGSPVVYELANRFRLEPLDPGAARSRVRQPIIFYIDTAAPEPIRTALFEGVAWWREAFEAAGYVDAFRVEMLPPGIDPLDIRYNVVNWVNRATRGWSYGQVIEDPRTGEIIKGQVLLGSLRVRQDMLIFQGLVGAGLTGTGDPNDPVAAALARIRQLAAHEVGHALGLAHNFAASIQGRYSVMDYPAPRVRLADGAIDLTDAYGVGVGRWDLFAVDWLYGAQTDAEAAPIMAAAMAEGLRYVADDDARPAGAAHPIGSLWDDYADPVEELRRMMDVRAVAVSRFGPEAIGPGEPESSLRRAFVPIWLLHRYQVDAAAKLVGGVDYSYGVRGGGHAAAQAVSAGDQRRALGALLDTLSPAALTVPPPLVPSLSVGWSGNRDRQTDIEIMPTAGGPVFDPFAATETGAAVTLSGLLAPERLNRLEIQHQADPQLPGADELIDQLIDRTFDFGDLGEAQAAVQRRIATTTVLALARVQRDPELSPTLALALSERLVRLSSSLARTRGDGMQRDWSRGLARLLADREALQQAVTDERRLPKIPPGMPIGAAEGEWPGL